jgi:hypothetical protein
VASSKSGINAVQRLPGSDIGVRHDDRFNGNTTNVVVQRVPYAAHIRRSLQPSRNYMSRPLRIHPDTSALARR